MSGNSWANSGQMCIKCNIMVYPHKQVNFVAKLSLNFNVSHCRDHWRSQMALMCPTKARNTHSIFAKNALCLDITAELSKNIAHDVANADNSL